MAAKQLPTVLGPPQAQATGQQQQQQNHRLQDFWASPASGSHGWARWQQTMDSIVLRLLLTGDFWEGAVAARDFRVRLCALGLLVEAVAHTLGGHRQATEQLVTKRTGILADSACGEFPSEVLVDSCWWSLEEEPVRKEHILEVHLTKAKDGSWPGIFCNRKAMDPAELCSDWITLRPGRPCKLACDTYKSNIQPEELLLELVESQTEELATLQLLLNQSLLEEVRRHMPMSRLFILDVAADEIQLCLRYSESMTAMLKSRLGGKVIPKQTDWAITKVSREALRTGGGCAGVCETCPALSVQLRKAPDSRIIWKQVIEASPCCVGVVPLQLPLGCLDEDCSSGGVGAIKIEGSPETGASSMKDMVQELKSRADESFRARDWEAATDFYTQALSHAPTDARILSNRSATRIEMAHYQDALDDALQAAEVAPEWAKPFFRQGVALRALRRYDMALSAFAEGQAREPSNLNWKIELEETEKTKAAHRSTRVRARMGKGSQQAAASSR
mmetsp:Transcript_83047/g.164721  ORF Transcript_83047/g.164721 Transcript_83047/m.164721 type:complete len:504 (-) Transcript_83047:4-1515(-)